MNRLEIAQEIAERVPMLAKRDKDEWLSAEALRSGFVADYPIARILALALDEYVIGKGPDNRSFCYRLEREMDRLGRILGATAFKFGVYFGRTKTDASKRYRFRRQWGRNVNEAFSSVKQAIVDLLQAAGREDSSAIADNRLSPMFKGKILFVYHPEQFAPIYSEEHLEHFVSELDLSGSFRRGTDMQISLMEYRATWPDLMAQPVPLYMRLLYDLFGYPPHDDSTSAGSARVPILNKAVEGAEFISHMPALSPEIKGNPKHRGTPNYEAHGKQLKRIGDRGEAVVFAMEKKRLLQAGRPDLADHIKHPSQEDDSIGYDILSFDEDGTDRPIEVKATSARNLDRGFYLTSNELEKAGTLPNYHIYLVFSALGNRPRVLPIKQPAMNGGDFHLNPVVYHATLPAHGVES